MKDLSFFYTRVKEAFECSDDDVKKLLIIHLSGGTMKAWNADCRPPKRVIFQIS